jgi:hypothetical protein
MRATARAFLERLIDYAGMFPPARLPMREALHHYTAYASAPESWMLGRFVCPATGLAELSDLIRADDSPPDPAVAALARGGRDLPELIDNLHGDFRTLWAFGKARSGSAARHVLELVLPSPLDTALVADLILLLRLHVRSEAAQVFIEVVRTPAWRQDVTALSERLANDRAEESPVGLKVRCGGTTAEAVPPADDLAYFICRCRDTGLPWKATAGLHHPLRRPDAGLQTMAHGFLNVFGAGILARVHGLDESEVLEVLREESPETFRFSDDRFSWRDRSCTLDEVRDGRRWLPSFGSCSFTEPCDDLRALGLIG